MTVYSYVCVYLCTFCTFERVNLWMDVSVCVRVLDTGLLSLFFLCIQHYTQLLLPPPLLSTSLLFFGQRLYWMIPADHTHTHIYTHRLFLYIGFLFITYYDLSSHHKQHNILLLMAKCILMFKLKNRMKFADMCERKRVE